MSRLLLLGVALCAACSSSATPSTTTTDAGATGTASPDAAVTDAATSACATLPASAVLQGGGCTGVAGTFTAVTFDTAAGTYDETCSAPAPYKDQAEFDANEGTSSSASVTITSHEDYVVTASCASGSIDYTASGSAKTKIVFFWTKVP